jgi:hypothetical protein
MGIYGYRREALLRLVQVAPVSPLEQAEKLEQLRALENGIEHRRGPGELRQRGRGRAGVHVIGAARLRIAIEFRIEKLLGQFEWLIK